MENLNEKFAGQVLLAAIEAGAFKLCGPSGTVEQAGKNAKIDAAYMLALITALTQKPPG